MWKVLLSIFLISLPALAAAAGLVPCGGPGEDPCQTCHVVQLINKVSGWLVLVLGVAAAIRIVLAGFRMVVSVGNVAAKTDARRAISNTLIGYIILLAAWLFIDFGLKTMLSSSAYGVWNVVQCVAQPTAIAWSRPTASGDNATVLSSIDISSRVSAITSSGALQTDIANAAAAAGITDPDQIKALKALISQESSNCTKKVGPMTNSGVAYGCGQMLVSTARSLDKSLSSLSDADVATKLENDDAYNLTLSAKYYSQLLAKNGNKTDLALAAYNGGGAANQPSVDCPGLKRWQCVWDSPGCYGTGKTDCLKNQGPNSYEQTRNYVSNITKIADNL